MLKGLILTGSIVVVWGVARLVVLRIVRPTDALKLMLVAYGSSIPVYMLVYVFTPPTLWVLPERLAATPASLGLWNGVFGLILLSLTAIQFYYHVHRSITLRLISEFERSSTRSMTLSEIEETCGLQVLIGSRLDALQRQGLVRERAGRYYLTAVGALVAVVGRAARRVLTLKPY